MFNWNINFYDTYPNILKFIPLTYFELLFMIMAWPFNIWTSFLNLFWPSGIMGMAPFIIYNNSTAAP